MIKIARAALVLAAASAMFGTTCGTLLADGTTGSIYGRVYLKGSHRPAAGVVVRVVSNSEPSQETRTGPDGSFSFAAVFPGAVAVTIGRDATPVDVHPNIESDETFVVTDETVASAR